MQAGIWILVILAASTCAERKEAETQAQAESSKKKGKYDDLIQMTQEAYTFIVRGDELNFRQEIYDILAKLDPESVLYYLGFRHGSHASVVAGAAQHTVGTEYGLRLDQWVTSESSSLLLKDNDEVPVRGKVLFFTADSDFNYRALETVVLGTSLSYRRMVPQGYHRLLRWDDKFNLGEKDGCSNYDRNYAKVVLLVEQLGARDILVLPPAMLCRKVTTICPATLARLEVEEVVTEVGKVKVALATWVQNVSGTDDEKRAFSGEPKPEEDF